MNKAIAATLTAALLLSMGTTTAFADGSISIGPSEGGSTGSTTNNTKKTEVKYEVTQSYEWSVPANVTFSDTNNVVTADGTSSNSDSVQAVHVTKNVIPADSTLKITVTSTNKDTTKKDFTIVSEENATLHYTIKKQDSSKEYNTAIEPDGIVTTVAAGINAKDEPLQFTLTKDSVEKAGTYVATLAFTAEVVKTDTIK